MLARLKQPASYSTPQAFLLSVLRKHGTNLLAMGENFDIREVIDWTVLGYAWDALSENTRRAYTEARIRWVVWIVDPTDDRLKPKARKRDNFDHWYR